MKGQTCADGQKDIKKAVPGDVTFPTVYTEYVLTTETIDVNNRYDVSIRNILGAFLSADTEEDMEMVLHGRLAELMVNIVPQIYRHHVIYKKGSLVLYITLNKALYGFLI